MKSKFVSNKFLSKYTECDANMGTEAKFYHNDLYLLKIIKEEFLSKDRELIVRRLEELTNPALVTPEFLLHNRKGFTGYGMIEYKEHFPLEELITNDMFNPNINLSFKDRKKLALVICKLFRYLNDCNFSFYDIHDRNILINNELDAKLIDLDSGVFKGTINNGIDYHASYIHSSRQLALFTLSFLYNMYFNDFERAFAHPFSIVHKNKDEMLKQLPYKVRKYFEFVLSREFYVFDETEECIDAFDEETFNITLQTLKKRL